MDNKNSMVFICKQHSWLEYFYDSLQVQESISDNFFKGPGWSFVDLLESFSLLSINIIFIQKDCILLQKVSSHVNTDMGIEYTR